MIGYFTAPRIAFGSGAIEQLSALELQRPAVVAAPSLARDHRLRRIVEELAKREVGVAMLEAPPGRPGPEAAERLARSITERGPDWIVAVGGGRTLDLARAAWLRYERPDLALEAITPLAELKLRAKARFVAIPTTSGSGAESSPALRLWTEAGAIVRPTSRELIPDWVLLDPALPLSTDRAATADAAAIALGHALESRVSAWTNPISAALSGAAAGELFRALPKVARSPDDAEARTVVHHAASLAGLAAANGQDGAAAGLAEAMVPALGLSYGRCLGIVLPYVVEFNYPSSRDDLQALAPLLGPEAIAHRSDLPRRLRVLLDGLGIPRTLAAAGISEERLRDSTPAIIALAGRSPAALSNPRVPSPQEWGRLLEAAQRGSPVDF